LVQAALDKWPPGAREGVRRRIEAEIANHYSKTPDVPIPAEVPGPSGVTWKYLYMLATRGDVKGRKTPNYQRRADAKDTTVG
jgi:hypothetical protein